MELQEAIEIVRKLADGLHPETGQSLPGDCLFQHPQAVRALQHAVDKSAGRKAFGRTLDQAEALLAQRG